MDKDPEIQKEEKKNTDAWKLKQEEKKKKKEAESQGEAKKEKKKKDKDDEKKVDKKEESKPPQKENKETSKNSEIKNLQVQSQKAIQYRKLIKIDSLLTEKARIFRSDHEDLITKYMEQHCLSDSDVVLYIGEKGRITKHQQVYLQDFNKCTSAELVCRYSDLSYFLEGTITKIFIEVDVFFSNGSVLAKEGTLNIALMGSYFKIPVIAVGGSWNYNGWGPVNYQSLQEKYGSEALKNFDWIETRYFKTAVTEIGMTNPKQISINPPLVYKDLNFQREW